MYFSFGTEGLPEHSFVLDWMDVSNRRKYWGDVFVVKMAPHDYGKYFWAAYEDIVSEFLDLLVKGRSQCGCRHNGSERHPCRDHCC